VKQRWIALGLAAAALLTFYALLFPTPAQRGAQLSRPLTTETGADGLAGAWRWLEASKIPVVSLRERYTQLPQLSLPLRGNVLLVSFPVRLPAQATEQVALKDWIERGNTLLILAALDDTPAWAQGDDVDLLLLQDWVHMEFSTKSPPNDNASLGSTLTSALRSLEIHLEPLGGHALLRDVHEISVTSELPASHWVATTHNFATLAIARRRDDGNPALWLQAHGSGQIVVCALAAAFSNAQITRADNARLLSNIIGWSRGPDGRVLFDDAHQGLVSFYDPHTFFADARLHHSLLWILALWVVWVLGSQPLRLQQQLWAPIDETRLVEAGGGFYSRHVPAGAAARALLENFFNELHRRLHQSEDGTPPWEWLATQPRIPPGDLEALQSYQQRVSAHQKVDLARLQNLLAGLRRSME
jgi:hypothetical protein